MLLYRAMFCVWSALIVGCITEVQRTTRFRPDTNALLVIQVVQAADGSPIEGVVVLVSKGLPPGASGGGLQYPIGIPTTPSGQGNSTDASGTVTYALPDGVPLVIMTYTRNGEPLGDQFFQEQPLRANEHRSVTLRINGSLSQLAGSR